MVNPSPAGRRWPAGPDEGTGKVQIAAFAPNPHPCPLPGGEGSKQLRFDTNQVSVSSRCNHCSPSHVVARVSAKRGPSCASMHSGHLHIHVRRNPGPSYRFDSAMTNTTVRAVMQASFCLCVLCGPEALRSYRGPVAPWPRGPHPYCVCNHPQPGVSKARTGAKLRRCSGQGPSRRRASRCVGVG